jgi:hypothetical protein
MMAVQRRLLPGHYLIALLLTAIRETDSRNDPARDSGSLLGRVLPQYDYRGVVTLPVAATPAEVFRALREVTLADMPLAYLIGSLRYLPGRLLGRTRPQADQLTRPFLEITMPVHLGEEPDREMVVGSIGKLHNLLDQQFVQLKDAQAFADFDNPDYEKFAMNFRVTAANDDSSTLSSDYRTLALGPSARRKFAVYWYLMVGWGGNFMLRQMLKAVKRRAERDHTAARSTSD